MNRWQKIAWYNLIIIFVSFSLTAAVVGILALKYGMPKALGGLGALGTLGLLGLSPVLFREKKGERKRSQQTKKELRILCCVSHLPPRSIHRLSATRMVLPQSLLNDDAGKNSPAGRLHLPCCPGKKNAFFIGSNRRYDACSYY